MPDVLLRSEESDGVVSVVDNTVPAHWPGPFLHKHDFDEAFYVLEGELDLPGRGRGDHQARGRAGVRPARRRAHAREPQRRARRATCSCARRPASSATSRAMNENPPEWALQEIPFEVERVGPQIGQS